MKPCLREALAKSHVAAVAIAILIFWFISFIFEAFWPWIARAGEFLFTAVAILDIPYFSVTVTRLDSSMLLLSGLCLYAAVVSISAAWLLALWVYGREPLQVLASYYNRLQRMDNA